jgi:hypothetical protein
MKPFYPTYLYIKTHNVTGLKYFGKTTKDPLTYRGSGNYWISHLKIHGNDVTTEILGYYTDQDECQKAALKFSIDNDIINAVGQNNKKIWANQIVENGLDGGYTVPRIGFKHSDESRKLMSDQRKGRTPWNKGLTGLDSARKGCKLSDETRKLLSEANLGKKQSLETIEKRRSKLIGHSVSQETRDKISNAQKGKTLSAEHIQKLKDRTVSDETKDKIRRARANQIFTEETKQKLSGKVVVVDRSGNKTKISKEQYYSQSGPKEEWEFINHRHILAKQRISQKDAEDVAKMRR